MPRGELRSQRTRRVVKGELTCQRTCLSFYTVSILTGETTNSYFGWSVSTAGDVNGDGYDDVIVGAYGYSSGTGRAYIYYGGPSMDNVADVTMTGEATGNYFGHSVSTAGDVNGDGYSDVIVGAYGYSSSTGRAYIYLSSSPPIVPHIMSVKDVPNDQGGKVTINWVRSALDVKTINGISSYTIERSYLPPSAGYSWEVIANITPQYDPKYTYTASTPYDSMSGTNGTFYFRVTAKTDDASEFWRSNVVSGHSVDNIPPIGVDGGGIAAMGDGEVVLSWDKDKTDTDLKGYNIYRSITDGFALSDSTKLAQTTDTTFTDSSTTQGDTYYYRIAGVDIHGNVGTPSSELNVTALSLELSAFTATQSNTNVILQWTMTTETNDEGFDVERSVNNNQSSVVSWQQVGYIQGAGTSNSPKEYSFSDENPAAGTYSYRLKQVERDGSFKYSQTVEVEVVVPKVFGLSQNYPNPFNPATTLEFTVPTDGRATLKVYNTLGQEVATVFDGNAVAGQYHQATFDGTKLSSGIYFARLQYDGKQLLKKMLMVK